MISCTFEDGGHGTLRHVVVDAIILKDSKILMCKRGSHNGKPLLGSGKWALIGGFMDRDEDSQQAIIREAQEESGCAISDLTLLQVIDYPHRTAEVRQNIAFVYIAHTTDDFVTGNEEVQDLAWFSLDALPPPEEIAFDHVQMLELYKKYLTTPFTLPIVGKPHSS